MDNHEERRLLDLWVGGGPAGERAAKQLWEHWVRSMWRGWLKRRFPGVHPDDIQNDAFADIYPKVCTGGFVDPLKLKNFAIKVIRNKAVDALRSHGRNQRLKSQIRQRGHASGPPSGSNSTEDAMKKWLDGNRDSHPEREIVELVTGASLVNGKLVTSPGITQADAARQLGLHPDQVKRVVQKLRQHIARRLSND